MYDPLERASALEPVACRGDLRRYYRFRPARWYGGIVTGDVVACNLLCHFCWARDDVRAHPERTGEFFSPEEAFGRLRAIAAKKGYRQMRLSGQEPTIGREHLVALIGLVDKAGYDFILETNGILLGSDPGYARALSGFKNLHVRVSLKGACEEEFQALTGARPDAFGLQLAALGILLDSGVPCHPAVMTSFSTRESIENLVGRLGAIDPRLVDDLEVEELILYPHVVRRLKDLGLDFGTAHGPGNVPERLI